MFENTDISVFVFQGVMLVAAAVAIVSQVDHLWVALADRLSSAGRGLAIRLGLAYPLDRKFRTGMLLGMFAIVIFTMMFLSVFGELFARQGPAADRRGARRLRRRASTPTPPTRCPATARGPSPTVEEAAAAGAIACPEFTSDVRARPLDRGR